MLAKLHARLAKNDGFTLIELLVVMIIIGILVAIAVPSYLSLRGRAHKSAAESDLRALVPDIESYYADNGTYDTGGATAMSIQYLHDTYDNSINTVAGDPVYEPPTNLGAKTYCFSVTDGDQRAQKAGPDAPIIAGSTDATAADYVAACA
jgi:prepilin-type N-terminal cleavage/methylation domain-containing protein